MVVEVRLERQTCSFLRDCTWRYRRRSMTGTVQGASRYVQACTPSPSYCCGTVDDALLASTRLPHQSVPSSTCSLRRMQSLSAVWGYQAHSNLSLTAPSLGYLAPQTLVLCTLWGYKVHSNPQVDAPSLAFLVPEALVLQQVSSCTHPAPRKKGPDTL